MSNKIAKSLVAVLMLGAFSTSSLLADGACKKSSGFFVGAGLKMDFTKKTIKGDLFKTKNTPQKQKKTSGTPPECKLEDSVEVTGPVGFDPKTGDALRDSKDKAIGIDTKFDESAMHEKTVSAKALVGGYFYVAPSVRLEIEAAAGVGTGIGDDSSSGVQVYGDLGAKVDFDISASSSLGLGVGFEGRTSTFGKVKAIKTVAYKHNSGFLDKDSKSVVVWLDNHENVTYESEDNSAYKFTPYIAASMSTSVSNNVYLEVKAKKGFDMSSDTATEFKLKNDVVVGSAPKAKTTFDNCSLELSVKYRF